MNWKYLLSKEAYAIVILWCHIFLSIIFLSLKINKRADRQLFITAAIDIQQLESTNKMQTHAPCKYKQRPLHLLSYVKLNMWCNTKRIFQQVKYLLQSWTGQAENHIATVNKIFEVTGYWNEWNSMNTDHHVLHQPTAWNHQECHIDC